MRFDGKKPIEFTDDTVKLEQENLEEIKYTLKGSAPSTDSSIGGNEDPLAGLEDAPEEDPLAGLEDANGGGDKPFDDEPFDAGVDADEDTDPEKYIQQLAGKLGQSLRQYTDDQGQPDFDLEKFAVNSVLSATHTSDMDQGDQKDIINKVKGAGSDDSGDDLDNGDEEPTDDIDLDNGGDDLDFGDEEPVEEVEELPIGGSVEEHGIEGDDTGSNIDPKAVDILKDLAEGDSKFGNDERFGNDKRWGGGLQEGPKNWLAAGLLALSMLSNPAKAQNVNSADMDAAKKVAFNINKGRIDRDTIVRTYGNTIDTTFINKHFDKNGKLKKTIEIGKIVGPDYKMDRKTKKSDFKGTNKYDKDIFGKEKTRTTATHGDGDNKTVDKYKVDMKSKTDFDPNKYSLGPDDVNVKQSHKSTTYRDGKKVKNEDVNLKESKKSGTFVGKDEILKELKLMENTEPLVEPITKPITKPARPMRETDRPFLPKRKDKVKPDPKAEDNGMINDDINE